LQCGDDASCLDGWIPHSLSHFTWLTAPAGKVLTFVEAAGPVVKFYDGDEYLSFDVTRGVFKDG